MKHFFVRLSARVTTTTTTTMWLELQLEELEHEKSLLIDEIERLTQVTSTAPPS